MNPDMSAVVETGATRLCEAPHRRGNFTWPLLRWMGWNMQYHTAHHTFPAVPFHRLPELHAELERRLGYSPPTVGYVEFQRRFIAALTRGPESVEGVDEVGSVIRRAA